MNKKIQKLAYILVIAVAIVSIATNVFAEITPGNLVGKDPDSTQIVDVGQNIIGILRTVGVVLSVIVLIILGIKYMMGSAEEKSEYKKTFIPYIVGAALIFAASVFAEAIYGFFNGMNGAK